MASRKLSPAEMQGIVFMDEPASPQGATARKLTPEELAGVKPLDAEPSPAPAPSRQKSLPERAYDTFAGAADKVTAGLRGLSKGATFGFSDEITAAMEAPFSDKTYEQLRDEKRAIETKTKQLEPGAFFGGEVIGAITGPGSAARATSVLGAAGRAAVGGAVYGAGDSTATTLGGIATDAAISGAISGATGGLVHKAIRSAPTRAITRLVEDITLGAKATLRDRVAGKGGKKAAEEAAEVFSTLKQHPDALKAIKKSGRSDPAKAQEAVEGALSEVGDKAKAVYGKIDDKLGGIKVSDVIGQFERVAAEMEAKPLTRDLGRALRSQAEDVLETWGGAERVAARDVRELATGLGKKLKLGNPTVDPTAANKAGRSVYAGLTKQLENAAEEAGAGAAKLRALNQQTHNLLNVRDALEYRAMRAVTPTNSIRGVVNGAADLGLLVTNPAALVGKKAIEAVGAPVARSLDYQLARLVTAARNGSTPAQIAVMAAEAGIAPATARAVSAWAANQADNLGLDLSAAPQDPQTAP